MEIYNTFIYIKKHDVYIYFKNFIILLRCREFSILIYTILNGYVKIFSNDCMFLVKPIYEIIFKTLSGKIK